jgi:hypothetical protein
MVIWYKGPHLSNIPLRLPKDADFNASHNQNRHQAHR